MMKKKARSRSGIFLTEMILVIFFFSLVAACCLQIFAKAVQMNTGTRQRKCALNALETIHTLLKEETMQGNAQDKETRFSCLLETYPQLILSEDGQACLFLDESGSSCLEEGAFLEVSLEGREEDGLFYVDFLCSAGGSTLLQEELAYAVLPVRQDEP